ncbi:hypothetical protein LTR91_012540 [Friedmanniomyces endolithicus]|uniref:Uncharacterized protein n=1 Tax=Friedmanniomyces endolithicus TaxID=329885 RepID=A0AAN6QQI9_9PEZI|nr:hypothetical protein LTR75_007966 [Friedmanniomyces endolithicus]KAK0848340.1 hypothetical protein LTR03_005812 [Friedmanniomyces endolithicus]KAK0883786.1 hypothetical protein LTR87_002526 [Friedmanniomyces endolithicus]KAK0979634.1 hypothetical protein LTR91_012540 [Friedmanniomyces endolithicus]KAK1037706.1 hypothetical protein LTS16_012614 [Friedmanniomyces endolithicus]
MAATLAQHSLAQRHYPLHALTPLHRTIPPRKPAPMPSETIKAEHQAWESTVYHRMPNVLETSLRLQAAVGIPPGARMTADTATFGEDTLEQAAFKVLLPPELGGPGGNPGVTVPESEENYFSVDESESESEDDSEEDEDDDEDEDEDEGEDEGEGEEDDDDDVSGASSSEDAEHEIIEDEPERGVRETSPPEVPEILVQPPSAGPQAASRDIAEAVQADRKRRAEESARTQLESAFKRPRVEGEVVDLTESPG